MPDLKAYANIELNATPTADNHLVTKSYLSNNFISSSIIAPEWDDEAIYNQGDSVMYNGKLYHCTGTSYTSPPTTATSVWVEAKLGDTASSSSYGIVKPGTGLTINNGTLNLTAATTSATGGVIVGDGLTVSSGTVSVSWGRKKAQSQTSGNILLIDSIGVYIVKAYTNTTISFLTTYVISTIGYSIGFTLILVEQIPLVTYTLPNTVTWLNDAPVMDTTNTAHIIEMNSYNLGSSWFATYKGSMPSSAVTVG